jgi:hypothetical protein
MNHVLSTVSSLLEPWKHIGLIVKYLDFHIFILHKLYIYIFMFFL